ncbi:hypothetical protein ACFSSC_08715 [Corynebacterium mendelii]|uniref:DUF624 domain-containing protein n=1 Tax=Corynebacterium mendelii TaxID=2765362 RepID=A0A939E1N2_9CORY|nr:hypothetical protein [Corynebacterium mendelii]MBN9645058.1 hypothetical protein [Corynebacterium mendelii]
MKGLLDLDGRLLKLVSFLADTVVITVLVVLSFLPVVTGGAGVCAAQQLFHRRRHGAAISPVDDFFTLAAKAFPATVPAWLVAVTVTAATGAVVTVLAAGSPTALSVALRALMIVIWMVVAAWVGWYLLAAGYTTARRPEVLARRAVGLSMVFLPHTAAAVAVAAIPLLVAAVDQGLAANLAGFYLIMGVGLTISLQMRIVDRPVTALGRA